MRSDWQSHCLVITVWWTSIVFRLVETEACWASACSTNANLFHVDIISHCLLSNHNTCLIFFFFPQWKCFAWEFILFWLRGRRGEARGHGRDHLCDAPRWGLFIWRGFWVMLSNVKERKKEQNARKQEARWVTDEGYSQRELLWKWPDMSAPVPPVLSTAAVHPGDKPSGQQVRWRRWTAGGASNVQGLADKCCSGYWDEQQWGQVAVKQWSLLEGLVSKCTPCCIVTVVVCNLVWCTEQKLAKRCTFEDEFLLIKWALAIC